MTEGADTTIGTDAVFTGRVGGQDLSVQGTFEGEAVLKGALRVGPKGRVKATVQAAVVEVRGEFEGEVTAGSLLFGETARASGTFRAERLTIRDGAVVNGSVNGPDRGAPKGPAEPASA